MANASLTAGLLQGLYLLLIGVNSELLRARERSEGFEIVSIGLIEYVGLIVGE